MISDANENARRTVKTGTFANAYLVTAQVYQRANDFINHFIRLERCVEGGDCGTCRGCVGVNSKKDSYIHTISTDGEATIDDVRAVLEQLRSLPAKSIRRFVVIRADSINRYAQSCLLKSLEDPPRDTTFFIHVRQSSALLPTIVSRCHKFNLMETQPHASLREYVSYRLGQAEADDKIQAVVSQVESMLRGMDIDKIIETMRKMKSVDEQRTMAKIMVYSVGYGCMRSGRYNFEIAAALAKTSSMLDMNVNPGLAVLSLLTTLYVSGVEL